MKPKPDPIKAVPCMNKYKGRQYYKFHVVVQGSGLFWVKRQTFGPVIAASPSDAIEVVREDIYKTVARKPNLMRPLEFFTWGVKGGETYRFSGWESIIGGAMMHRVTPVGQQRDWVKELCPV